MFSDAVRYLVRDGDVKVWKVINLSPDTHPVHIHLIQFKLLARDTYSEYVHDTGQGYESHFEKTAPEVVLDEAERGWKDTIRVNPAELVTLAMPFRDYGNRDTTPDSGTQIGITGRYVYHCHILEHEDHEMMRPYVVMPPAVIDHMHHLHGAGHMGSMPNDMGPSGWTMDPDCAHVH